MSVGGAELLAYRLAQKLRNAYRFVFCCLDELGELGQAVRADGFPVHVLGRRPGFDWRCVRWLKRLLVNERISLVHAHQYTPFFYAVASRQTWRSLPVLFTEHGRFHPDRPSWKRLIFNRAFMRRGDRVIAVGSAVRRALIDNEGIQRERVAVIYNGIDPSPYLASTSLCAHVRRELGLSDNDFVLAQVARLDPLKDHCTALRTVSRLADNMPNVRLLLVGDGPQRRHIEREIARKGLDSYVRLLGTRRDVERILAAADLFLLTSISEGIPLTLLEAMAAGRPPVATRVGGVSEVVEDGATGVLVPAGDDQALATAIQRLAGDAPLRRRMGAAGQQRAIASFSEQQNHRAYSTLYGEMLNG
jgi:glycosyltransferase involved in cell wall biosynthesis